MLETKIDELIAALDRNTAAQGGDAPAKPGRKPRAAATESTQAPAATGAPAASAPAAPATTAAAPVSSPTPPATLLKETTDAIIKLAGEFSRASAVEILSKKRGERPGVVKCSELNPLDWQDVLNETNAAIAAAQAAKASASLV